MFKLPKFEVNWRGVFGKTTFVTVGQLGACAALLHGVAHYSVAGAWILGGLIALVAIERNS